MYPGGIANARAVGRQRIAQRRNTNCQKESETWMRGTTSVCVWPAVVGIGSALCEKESSQVDHGGQNARLTDSGSRLIMPRMKPRSFISFLMAMVKKKTPKPREERESVRIVPPSTETGSVQSEPPTTGI